MKKKRHALFPVLLLAACLLFPACQSAQDKARLAALETIYEGARQSFAYWALVPGLDWDGLYEAYKPRVLAAQSDWEYYQELRRFTAHLRDGHTQLYLPAEAPCTLPLQLKYLEGQYVLWGAYPAKVDIPLGAAITHIDGVAAEAWLESRVGDQLGLHTPGARQDRLAAWARQSATADTLTLAGTAPDGTAFETQVTYLEATPRLQYLELAAMGTSIGSGYYYGMKAYSHGDGIYQVTLPGFQDARLQESFARFIEDYGDRATAFILDVRGNSGGNGLYGADILTYFCPYESLTPLSAQGDVADTMPEGYEAIEAEIYARFDLHKDSLLTQPVVILADWHCGSAGDDFVAMAKDTGRFTVMGTNTAGSTGQLVVYDLADGRQVTLAAAEEFQYPEAFIGISAKRTVWGQAGHDIINAGIPPDIWAEQSVADFQAGVDTVLTLALEALRQGR